MKTETTTGEYMLLFRGPHWDRGLTPDQLQQAMDAAMDELTSTERAAFTLRHHEGRSIDEICSMLRLGKSAAKHAVFRAVRKLRATLGPLHAENHAEEPS